jgi:hypothetical protein
MVVESAINKTATRAIANAMYRHTFGIVVDGKFGAEGRELGSGIGVLWKSTYLILTADHVVDKTPFERLYFLLPDEALEFEDDDIASGSRTVKVRKRFALEKPEIIEDDDDLAAFILPTQAQETGRNHFYRLDEHHVAPSEAEQIGVLGYPADARIPVGANYMATLYLAFGQMGHPASSEFADSDSRISINYPTQLTVDPPGLSGSGLWLPTSGNEGLWKPTIQLVGLTTIHDQVAQKLVGYKVENLIEFLSANDDRISKN